MLVPLASVRIYQAPIVGGVADEVEVRIKDNGLDSIEVIDNGSGIAEVDWESVGQLFPGQDILYERG